MGKVEELIKSLPEFEISNDGKTIANGKNVDKSLLNKSTSLIKTVKLHLRTCLRM